MKRKYQFHRLSPKDSELLQMVLQEEPDIQSWYAIRWSVMLDCEQFVCLH